MIEQPTATSPCAVVELRRYKLHPGTRDTMIELFDTELVETQEAVDMRVLGQFRHLDDPDAFVWLRGFRDMRTRGRGLNAFYEDGPVWARHSAAARATMIDTTNVLLLRPVDELPQVCFEPARRPPRGCEEIPAGVVTATIVHLDGPGAAAAFPAFFESELKPALLEAGAELLGSFASEHAPNNFPRLPVREEAEVFVWLSGFADEAAHAEHAARFDLSRVLADRTGGTAETWKLTPTSRSLLVPS